MLTVGESCCFLEIEMDTIVPLLRVPLLRAGQTVEVGV